MAINSVNLSGNITGEVKYQTYSNDKRRASFTIAVDKRLTKAQRDELKENGQAKADYISCIAWDEIADIVNAKMIKGTHVALSGYLQTSYMRKDKIDLKYTNVVVTSIDAFDKLSEARKSEQTSLGLMGYETPSEREEGY